MKLIATIAIFVTSTAALSVKRWNTDGQTFKLRYVEEYKNADFSFNNVACSNGENGMLSKGYNKIGDIPKSNSNVNVYVGGVYAVEGWGSKECGSCWEVYYDNKAVRVVAVDTAAEGFNLPQSGMDELTNGRAHDLGVVDVTAKELSPADCGL
ncbi:allergenic cerato-platanin asp f13 [Moniliophthora roreri MCA 2997]|uniref:Allergenic cerato-platanin asp f13 n=2 Tax=Moniliophthora roreri TaxID=221103 RepID=V2Y704_MONRO|nr:putative cerato-platanin [Moniliophthora roreri]ESK87459.1 allergenic cerato-platanin asp f13 [Moniliophthora roreri MCA 2997]KAI3617009.1 allergenic cerato-platanin asp f13 [Moniliophthora roreri]